MKTQMLTRSGTALLSLFLASQGFATVNLPASLPTGNANQSQLLMTTVMKKAAYDFASTKAEEKKVQASDLQKKAALLNSLSLSGNVGQAGGTTKTATTTPTTSSYNGANSAMTLSLTVSLATLLQVKQNQLSTELIQSGLAALRMQLASEAADSHLQYLKSSVRAYYLQIFIDGLKRIDASSSRGEIQLSAANRTLLSSAILNYTNLLTQQNHDVRIAAANLEKFIGTNPPDVPDAVKDMQTSFCSAFVTSGNWKRIDWTGINWKDLDDSFAVPVTSGEALQIADSSPALVTARLGEAQARNTWYLTLASQGPSLSVNVSQNYSHQLMDAGPDSSTTSAGISLGFSLGGGTLASLGSQELLEEAAQLSTQAQKLQIRTSMEVLYEQMASSREQLQASEQKLQDALNVFRKLDIRNEKDFGTFVDLLGSVDGLSGTVSTQTASLILTKIQIHAQMGTLLTQMNKEEVREKQNLLRTAQ